MIQSKARYLKDFFLLKKADSIIDADDIVSKQRLHLFKTYSLTAFIIALIITYQVISTFNWFDFIGIILTTLTTIIALNYFLLHVHRNFRLAYIIAIASSLLTLHVVTYYSGGIRNSGMMYLGGLILVTFMLLGNKEGKIISALSVLTLFFFYYISTYSGLNARNIIDSDSTGQMLNLDYLITYCTATLLIYSLSNNLENSKNIVIAKVTEAKETLEFKNEELKKLSLVASNTDNSVIITNKDGLIEWVNSGFERIKGYSLPEVIGKTTQELFYGPLTSEETINLISHNISHKKSFSGEVLKYRKDGSSIWLQVTITPILDDQGEVTRFIHVESDISERKKSEERLAEYYMYLEKANKELDKFAYVVSHDLKAPLRAISNLSSWIEEDIGDRFTADSAQHFTMLKGRIVRMESLINGILEYSRADRVKSPNVMVDVKALINEIFELIVQDSNVTIELPENLPVINTERMKLQQVFLNLISNSIKYNDKEKAVIKIACVEEEESYTFSVEDNGPGIEERYHEKVFIIFQTLQARDTFESTGVGLAIVKKIIDESGGEIWIESELGIYTRFLFRWPKKSSASFKSVQSPAEKANEISEVALN